jgi:MFS family permease|tara:strand:+ start:464 stop:1747 length:1284 start_codon:yes stop_codon:yes gene_type:complete
LSDQVSDAPHTSETPRKGRLSNLQTFSAFKYPNYRLLWISTLISSGGNWVQQVTIGWLSYNITEDALLTGSVLGIRGLPFLIAGPISGVLSDRMDRRKLMLITQVYLALLGLVFASLVSGLLFTDVAVWHLFVFTFLFGSGWAMNNPIRQAMVANSVPREHMMNAIAMNSAAFQVTRIIGPSVAGILIANVGPSVNFFIQAGAFVLVFVLVLPLRIPQEDFSVSKGQSFFANFKEGVAYATKTPVIMALILMGMIPSLFLMSFINGLMPVFAAEVLDNADEGLGNLLSAYGVGALIGTLSLASLGKVQHKGIMLLIAAMSSGLAMIAFSFTSTLWLSMLALVGMGATQMFYMATNNTLIQTIVPDTLRGRVLSLFMLDFALVSIGAIVAGAIAKNYGISEGFFFGGAVAFSLFIILGVVFKQLRGKF